MASEVVMEHAQWDSIYDLYKLKPHSHQQNMFN